MNDDSLVHVALVANHRYLPGLLATASSMALAASDRALLRFHVLSDGLTDDDKTRLSALLAKCGASQAVDYVEPPMSRIQAAFKPYKGSHAAFVRLFLCEIFPEEDWIIYADADTLWFRDPCRLWEERDSGFSVLWSPDVPSIAAGVREYSLAFNSGFDADRYACSGVMLMNLRKMRETGFVAKCEAFAAKWGTPFFVDQDILNTVCLGDSKLLDRRWDCMMPDRKAVDGVVIHCNGIGGRFELPMRSWRPSYYVWYRYYADVVLGEPACVAASFARRLLFWLLGFFYPPHAAIAFLCRGLHPQYGDQVERILFFAWLWRHAKWWGKWK